MVWVLRHSFLHLSWTATSNEFVLAISHNLSAGRLAGADRVVGVTWGFWTALPAAGIEGPKHIFVPQPPMRKPWYHTDPFGINRVCLWLAALPSTLLSRRRATCVHVMGEVMAENVCCILTSRAATH